MKRFSKYITEKKMTHVIDRKTGESVYGPTDVADAKRYLQNQPQPRKFVIRDIKESVELEDGKYVTVKQFVSDEAAQSAISDAEGLLDSTEIMHGVFAMVFDGEESKEQFTTKHKSDIKEDIQLDEAPNPEFLKVYDKLKKGDKVDVEFDSGIRKGHKLSLVVTAGHRVVGKSKVGRIIMKSPDNMRGVKYTLYNRNGSVSLALGDMATVLKSIKKK